MGISRFHKNLLNWIKNDYCEKQYKISSSSLWDRLSVIDGARVNRYMIFDDYGTFLIAIRSSLRDSRRDRFLSVSKANNWDVHNRWLAPTPAEAKRSILSAATTWWRMLEWFNSAASSRSAISFVFLYSARYSIINPHKSSNDLSLIVLTRKRFVHCIV